MLTFMRVSWNRMTFWKQKNALVMSVYYGTEYNIYNRVVLEV
jgi:hypothetical protein